MKINQFAYALPEFSTVEKELSTLGFTKETEDTKKLFELFLEKSFPQFKSLSGVKDYLTRLLATPEKTLSEFFQEEEKLSAEIFYHVALQLLKFHVNDFLTVKDTLKTCAKCGIPVITGDFSKGEVFLNAWYQLLNTHTTKGLTFIDDLANRGFYAGKNFPKPFFFNGKSQAVFNMNETIYEVVYVESALDTDEDGKRDLLKVEIIRPKASNEIKMPVFFTASPYDQGVNPVTGDAKMHRVNVPLERKNPRDIPYEDISYKTPAINLPKERIVLGEAELPEETFNEEKVYSLNNYLLARGFIQVFASGIGSKDSDGIQTCGSKEQTESMKNIVEWLAGNRRAFTNRTDNIEVKAWWSNKRVAMGGRSYLGTLATAVATTGVKGLETIVSEAAISNWYEYYRDNGLVIAPGGFPGEDCDVLAEETFSRSLEAGDYLKNKAFFDEKQEEMKRLQDRKTGNYNTFWDERNYLPHVKNIKCDIFMVHGVNDWNVKPRHVYQLWEKLQKMPIKSKLVLHQGQHIYINNMPSVDFQDMVNLWLSNKLYAVENSANDILPPVVFQDNLKAETWEKLSTWENEDSEMKTYYINDQGLSEEKPAGESKQTFKDSLEEEQFTAYTKNISLWEKDLKADNSPLENNRVLMKTAPLEDLFLSGAPKLSLKVASSVDFGMLSFQLVDYGKKKRLKEVPTVLGAKSLVLGYHFKSDTLQEFKEDQETPFKMITKGHINLQNRRNAYEVDDLKADEMVEISLDLQPTLYKIPQGHQLGLIIYATDFGMTVRGNQEIAYTVDLSSVTLRIPVQ